MCGLLVIFFASLGLEGGTLIVVAGVFLALVLILSMALSRPFMENLGARFVYGHTSMLGIHLAAAIGGLFGDPEKRIKEVELPKIIGFLREFSVSSFVILFILFIIMAPLAGIDYFQSLIGAEPWYLGLVLRPAAFACGITVLLYGVRIMVAELVPAFLGIGEKVIPGAIAGLDCPTVFPFNPICVPYFLLVEYAGQVLMTLIVVLLHNPLLPVAVPSIILATFYGGNASIPAEKIGGRTAGLIAAFVHGVLFNLMGSLCGPWVGPEIGMTVGNVDMSSVALISFGIRDFVLGVNPLWSLAMAVFGILLWVAVFAIPYFILHKGMKRLKKAAYLVK